MVHLILFFSILMSAGSAWAEPAPSAPPPTDPSIYHVRILQATYGKNCSGAPVAGTLRIQDPNGRYPTIETNNALEAMQKLCDGKKECLLTITPETLGMDPAPHCKKKLSLRYRCFNFDAPHTLTLNDKDAIQIRCTPPTNTSTEH